MLPERAQRADHGGTMMAESADLQDHQLPIPALPSQFPILVSFVGKL